MVRGFFTWYIQYYPHSRTIYLNNTTSRTLITHTRNQAALFVLVEVHLLSFVKDESNYSRHTNKSARHALLIFTYSALFFCLSAAVSGLILTDEFGELPVRASRKKDPIQEGVFDSNALDLLRSYGAKRSWIWVMWHCECQVPPHPPKRVAASRLPSLSFCHVLLCVNFVRKSFRAVLPRRKHHFSNHTITPLHLARRIQFCKNHAHVHFAFCRTSPVTSCTAPPGRR